MGLYDTITCKYPLPMPADPKGYSGSESFQTKDLENGLLTYEIREDGSIWLEKVEGDYVPGDNSGKDFWERFGHFEITKKWWEKVPITDSVDILDYQTTDGDYDYCIEYKIFFKNGLVSNLELIRFSAESNTDRKESNRKMNQEMEDFLVYKKTFRYRFFFGPYNYLVYFVFRKMSRFLNFLLSNCYRAEQFFKF